MKIKNVNTLSRACLMSVFALSLYGCGGAETTTDTAIVPIDNTQPVSDWELVWSDEFDGDSLNLNNWTFEVNCDGGGNFEQQCYTDSAENLFIQDGILNIRAIPTPADSGLPLPYTSSRINSAGKADFTYGRIEISAKMPQGQGSWPAFWMLPTDYVYGTWPKSGEIDIFETVNIGVPTDNGPETSVFGTLHYGFDFPNNDFSGFDFTPPDGINPGESFNTYAIEWQEGEIRWYMNGYLYAMQRASELRTNSAGEAIGLRHKGWYRPGFDEVSGEEKVFYDNSPFDQDFHLILNLAVGGNFPENTNLGGIDSDAFTNGQTLEVDWVRVYECSIDPSTGKGCESIRPGYDVAVEDGGAFVEGKAPAPTPPAPDVATPLVVFDDAENPDWPLWDCCGGTTPEVVMDEAPYGAVAEFRIENNDGAVLGFNSRLGEAMEVYNAGGFLGSGSLKFDMKVVNAPTAETTWLLKVEADGNTSFAEVPLNTSVEGADPVEGEWQSYTFPIQALSDAGLNVGAIDVILIFPAWQTGAGAIYRVDNVRIESDSGSSLPSLTLFEDEVNEDWVLWDCCGGTTPTIEMVDAPYGSVAQFEILNNDGTVLGFNTRESEGGGAAPFDATALLSGGVLQFDMRVVSAPSAETTWLIKVEADGNTSFAEVPLNTSTEGADPVTGEWQTYTFPISDLSDAGLDVSAIDVVLIFPAWQTGAGAIYQIDNFKIYDPNASGSSGSLNAVFTDGTQSNWAPWDCCGGTTPTIEMDEAPYNEVVEFSIENNDGTVLGFNAREAEGGGGMVFNGESILAAGKFQFDMKVMNAPSAETTWLLKIEADGNTSFAEVPLNTSNEGADPVEGQWQTYTFDMLALSDAGLDVSGIDVVLVFPAWQTGAGAVYRIDNVVFLEN